MIFRDLNIACNGKKNNYINGGNKYGSKIKSYRESTYETWKRVV